MKKLFLIIATAFFSLASIAQAQLVGYRAPNPGNRNASYTMAIEPQFDEVALDFSEGMACVMIQRGQFHTYIDTNGKPAFDKQFPNMQPFSEGLAAVQVNPAGGDYVFIDKKGDNLTRQYYHFPKQFSEGYAVVGVDVTGGGHYRYTYIDTKGQSVGEPRFYGARSFSEGHAAVMVRPGNWQVLNRMFKATSGNLPYDEIDEFHEGLARVKSGNRYGFIDTLGNLKIPMSDMWFGPQFSEGLCVVKQGGRYGYMDMSGRIVIPCRYTLAQPFSCSRAVVSQSSPGESGMIANRGIIDHDGNWVVEEELFDGIESFSECYAVVARDGKYGFINVNGKVVIPMKYEKVRSFHEGYAAVRQNGKWGFLKLADLDNYNKMK